MSRYVLLSGLLAVSACVSRAPERASVVDQGCGAGTPAARQCTAWLEAFNRGDRDAYAAFLRAHAPSRLARLDDEMDFRERTGGFTLVRVDESAPRSLVALVKERGSDQFARLTLEVGDADPHPIVRLELRAIPTPAGALPHLGGRDLIDATRASLRQAAAAGRFAGAVLIARHGAIVWQGAFGRADRERGIANTVNTRFRIGSMNKMFTAVAILQLVQAGRIRLDAPLGTYLPGYPNRDVASRVTIHQLLTHTGGTGDIFGPEFEAHRLELRTLDDYVRLYGSRGVEFEPGSRWDYSNYGFILLGAVIERVTGESYYDYVRAHVYEPAGMTASGSDPEDQTMPDRSVGYTRGPDGGRWRRNDDTLPYRGTSAGGGYSTVGDLLRFATALEQHRLLDAHHTELLTRGKVDTPNGRYAYGFGDAQFNGVRCFGHGGGAAGMNGDLEICPAVGYVVAVLANQDPPAATQVSHFITNRLPGQ